MSEERKRILRMVREGKISKEEGDELLAALEQSTEEKAEAPREEKAAEKPPPTPEPKPVAIQETPPSRSTGVMIAGFLLIFMSLAWLLGGTWGIVLRNPLPFLKFQPAHLTLFNTFGGPILYNTLFTIFVILILIPATGVLFFKEWARKMLVVVLALHTCFILLGTALVRVSSIGCWPIHLAFWTPLSRSSILIWLIVDIFLIWYFSRATIRPQFS